MAQPSSSWRLRIDSEEMIATPASVAEALVLAAEVEEGDLSGEGRGGDSVEIQFDADGAFVLYMLPDRTLLRPYFPTRQISGNGVEEFFCECCGVQLGDRSELAANCTTRTDGFWIFAEILNGRLPMSEEIEWVPLRPKRMHE